MLLERAPTPCDDKIYSAEWRAWRDPEIPDAIDPVEALIGRHLGTPTEHKTAIIADGEAITYGELARRVAVGVADRGQGTKFSKVANQVLAPISTADRRHPHRAIPLPAGHQCVLWQFFSPMLPQFG